VARGKQGRIRAQGGIGWGRLSYAVKLSSMAPPGKADGLKAMSRTDIRAIRDRARDAVNRYRLSQGHQAYGRELTACLRPVAGAAKQLLLYPNSPAIRKKTARQLDRLATEKNLTIRLHVRDTLRGPHMARLRADIQAGAYRQDDDRRRQAAARHDALAKQGDRRMERLRDALEASMVHDRDMLTGRDRVTLGRLAGCACATPAQSRYTDPALWQLVCDVLPIWQAVTGKRGAPDKQLTAYGTTYMEAPIQGWLHAACVAAGCPPPSAHVVARMVQKALRYR